MSHTIELSEKAFETLRRNAEKAGVTPEVWIETLLADKALGKSDDRQISDLERKQLNDFDKRMKQKLGEMWQEKFRREIARFNERHTD